jgi:hypothetical protein
MPSRDSHDTTVYLQVEPVFWKWGNTDDPSLSSIRAVRMTQKRPAKQKPGTVMVKLTLRIPDRAFLPLRPEATIVIPEDLIAVESITVEAGDPT